MKTDTVAGDIVASAFSRSLARFNTEFETRKKSTPQYEK